MRSLLVLCAALLLAHGLEPAGTAFACPVEDVTFPSQSVEGSGVKSLDAGAAEASEAAGAPVPVAFTREVIEPLQLPNGHKPKGLFDVDGDGDLDAVVRSQGIQWYEYPGWTAHPIGPSGSGEDAASADIDGDGDIDFCYSGNSDDPRCILNPISEGMDPRTTPWPETLIGTVGGVGGHDILLGDIDLDGMIDEIHLFGIFFQDPIGTWNPVSSSTIHPERGFKGTSMGDVDADGDLDLVVPSASSPREVLWLENPLPEGDPRVDAWTARAIGPGATAMTTTLADLSGDGRPDVLASPLSEPPSAANGLVWFEAPADPRAVGASWTERSIDPTAGFVHQGSIHVVDMNSDGSSDVFITEQEQSSSDRIAIYYNHGGGLLWTEYVIANAGGHNSRIGDIDGDGNVDILNVNHGFFGEPNPVEVYWNTGLPDTTVPVISDFATTVGESRVTLTWRTDEPTSARIDLASGSAVPRIFARDSYRELHIVVLDALACGASFDVTLEVADGAGHTAALAPFPVATAACGSETGPVSADLLALYEFDEGSDASVADTSGVGTPLDLTIDDPLGVTWLPGALRIDTPVSIASAGPATKIIDAVLQSGGVSVEAWIDPEADQSKDATLLAVDGAGDSNLRFEQAPFTNKPVFGFALRTQDSDDDGVPKVDGPFFAPSTELTHAVFTHHPDGTTRLYLDGVPVESNLSRQNSPFVGWDPTYGLVLANRDGGGQPWVGELHRIAVYGRALSGDEVLRNYAAGPGPSACDDGIDNDADGAVDAGSDGGCTAAADLSEREPGRACDDGLDGDGDGAVDFPADTGCADADAPDENAAPVSNDDVYRTAPGALLDQGSETGVLANDVDSEGAALTAGLGSAPAHGVLDLSADGAFTFTPDPGFQGIDSFTYASDDGAKSSEEAVARLVVAPPDAPAALDDQYAIEPDSSLVTDAASGVLANDDDPQGIETLSAVPIIAPEHGALSLGTDGSVDYTPDPGFAGVDAFTYQASDGSILSNPAVATLRVAPPTYAIAAHWRLDEGEGGVAEDSSGNDRDGSVDGPVWSLDTPSGSGASLDFDGNRVSVGPFDTSGDALTLAAFLAPDDFGVDDARIISRATGTAENDHEWMLGLTSTGGENRLRFRLTAGGSTTTLVASSGDLVAGQWVHAAAVYDGSSMQLYLDGELVGQQSKGGALTAGSMVDVALGNQPSGAGQRGFDGRLDDVRIYGAALSQAALRAIASGLGAPFVLQGVAQGGSIAILVEDVVVSVTTQPGQGADEVLAALAPAIDANPDLAALGITAHTTAEGLVSNGLIVPAGIDDAGFGGAAAVPGLGGLWAAALAALLAFFGQRRLARRAA